MLLARRNEGLETVLRGFVEDMRAKDGKKSTNCSKRERQAVYLKERV